MTELQTSENINTGISRCTRPSTLESFLHGDRGAITITYRVPEQGFSAVQNILLALERYTLSEPFLREIGPVRLYRVYEDKAEEIQSAAELKELQPDDALIITITGSGPLQKSLEKELVDALKKSYKNGYF